MLYLYQTTEKAIIRKEKHLDEEADEDEEVIYKIEVPANRYHLLLFIIYDKKVLLGWISWCKESFDFEAIPIGFFTWISLYFLINLKNGVFFTGLFGNSSARSSLRRLVYLMLVCYRYDLLCLEGLAQSLRVFNEQDKTPTYSLAKIGRESMLKMQVKPEVVIANCHDFQSDNYICMHDLCVLLL